MKGWGPPSAIVSEIPAVKPAQVSGLTGSASSRQVTLNWVAPDNGGLPIIRYEYQTNNTGGWTPIGVATQYVVGSLTNGTSYQFRVRAVNEVGNGSQSGLSTAVTPDGAISSPTGFSVARVLNSGTECDVKLGCPSIS